MSGVQLVVIAIGLFAGYWLVSRLFPSDTKPQDVPRPPTPGEATPRWHEVLGVAPNAAPDDIRQAYKSLLSQYHPDKVASLGSELKDVAERKSKQITQAYREALAARGLND